MCSAVNTMFTTELSLVLNKIIYIIKNKVWEFEIDKNGKMDKSFMLDLLPVAYDDGHDQNDSDSDEIDLVVPIRESRHSESPFVGGDSDDGAWI